MDEVIYISDDKVEDLTSYTEKEQEDRIYETINIKREKINDKENSLLDKDESDPNYEDDGNVPL